MNRSKNTERGEISMCEVSPKDAMEFRELRLYTLQDSRTAFSADYQRNLNHPSQYWEEMLTMQADESTIFLA
jgi:hypothetical protein